jgi:hypothetical protein
MAHSTIKDILGGDWFCHLLHSFKNRSDIMKMGTVARLAGFHTKDLGWLNGYNNGLPKEFEKCQSQGHETEGKEIGNCASYSYCPICNIEWRIDSSG